MIRRQVSAALLVRDAFTGQPFPRGNGTLCQVDGRHYTPVWKDGGYLVLTDLSPGEHTVTLRRQGYLDQTLTVPVAGGRPWEGWTGLLPGPGYPFPARTAWVELTLLAKKKPAVGVEVWLAPDGGGKLKLAQDKANAGDRELKLFYSGVESQLRVPGDFLIAGKKTAEVAALEDFWNGKAQLARPLTGSYMRGEELMPAQRYESGGDGRLNCVLRESGRLWALCEGKLSALEVQPGKNRLALSL